MINIYGGKENNNIKSFRRKKEELADQNYPLTKVLPLVEHVHNTIKDNYINLIKKDDLLITVPSTSGKNIIPLVFAKLIQKETGATIVPPHYIVKSQLSESKNNLNLKHRIQDQVDYSFNKQALYRYQNKNCFIVDDLLATGDNSIRLSKYLQQLKIYPKGLINLYNVTTRFPTDRDLERCATKIYKLINVDDDNKYREIKSNIATVFQNYTRQKLNRFERPINSIKLALEAEKVLAIAATQELNFSNKIKKDIKIKPI